MEKMATKRKAADSRKKLPSEESRWSPTDPKKLKEPGPKQEGLKKLPPEVRNKMGYMKDGGVVGKSAKVKELDDIIKKLKDGSSSMSSEALRTLKNRIKYNLGKKEGGMVLEIGLRPATKQEMKMAKEMKPQKKANGGMVARGTGQAIRGKGFKGVF